MQIVAVDKDYKLIRSFKTIEDAEKWSRFGTYYQILYRRRVDGRTGKYGHVKVYKTSPKYDE